jgi:hypothetical protein
MMIELNFIAGLMLGFELVRNPEDDDINHLVIDIFFLRFVCTY